MVHYNYMIGKNKIVYIWFAIGAVLTLLRVFLESAEISIAGITAVLAVLTTPGLVLVLPLMNFIAHPAWPIAIVILANGVVYGFIAAGIKYLVQKSK